MILAEVGYNAEGKLTAFTVQNHGDSYVCSAVSMLVINTINSIETLTGQQFDCDVNEEGVSIKFSLTAPRESGAGVLLDAMLLGLRSVCEQYPDEINLKEM